jgi:hypothetical protein
MQVLKGEVGIEAVPMQSIKCIQEALRVCTSLYQELSAQATNAKPSAAPGKSGATVPSNEAGMTCRSLTME